MSDSTSRTSTTPALDGIPLELLLEITSYVRRPHPNVRERATWSDYSQQDLTSLARVNRDFNRRFVPILYDSACVDDIEKFFSGLGDDTPPAHAPQSHNSPHARRLYLLSHVRRLHLLDRPVSNDMATSEPEGSEFTELRRYLDSVISTWQTVISAARARTDRLLPKLESLAIGYGDHAMEEQAFWRRERYTNDWRSYNPELIGYAEQLSNRAYKLLKPSRLCLLGSLGPLQLLSYGSHDPLPTTTLVTSYMPLELCRSVTIVSGAVNRLLVTTASAASDRLEGYSDFDRLHWRLDNWRILGVAPRNGRTRIKVYGLSHPGTMPLVREKDGSIDYDQGPSSSYDEDLATEFEMRELESARASIPRGWEGKFELLPLAAAPPGEYDGDNA